ncbi:hypothetical protein COL26b_005404 [Colletotrichum chrysophilum]|uniref:uncharacterized protein n=1 Tax=Colletotrichum chrysophilum TaxID=1836956 RepID=UPI002301B022|nr:uncharacterized protein COL26b_005404 [Colletotrichum chrysophilum]KAJ0376397.1 hypothetical protein COL26b_005404 [Colletotrichum chrysophilum]
MPSEDKPVLKSRLEELDDAFRCHYLLLPVEQVEEGIGPDDADLSVKHRETRVGRVQDVTRHKRTPEPALVPEQIVADVQKLALHIRSVKSGAINTVVCELPESLPDASAQVQQRVSRVRLS